VKEATVRRYHYGSHTGLREHLKASLLAYNFAKRLETLRGLTPYAFVCAGWEEAPERLVRDPTHDTLGLYT
jgi:hypothetical protein